MKKIYYMSEKSFYGNNAGSKARNDLEIVFERLGFSSIGPRLERKNSSSIFYYAKQLLMAKILSNKLKKMKDQIIFFQYPVTKGKVLNKYMESICHNNKVVFFVHDIYYIRSRDFNKDKDDEIAYLNMGSAIILHNKSMIEKLTKDGLNYSKCINLSIFDYLINDDEYVEKGKINTVAYAGSLAKAPFLKELDGRQLNYELHLFGDNTNISFDNRNIIYEGSFSPEELIKSINGSFGLIWDGHSSPSSEDDLINYTRYNNPHKASAYLAAGIPIIAWRESAIGKYIENNEIGIVVDSLNELGDCLNSVSKNEYSKIKKNVMGISNKIRKGYYTEKSIESAIEKLSK